MTDVHKALYAFWSSFAYEQRSIPAYLTGKVPKEETFPYITFDVKDGAFASSAVLTAFVWVKAVPGVNANAVRAAILDSVASAIPEGGLRIRTLEGTLIYLHRNSADFLSYYDDPEDDTVIGGRISYEVKYYHI